MISYHLKYKKKNTNTAQISLDRKQQNVILKRKKTKRRKQMGLVIYFYENPTFLVPS